MGASQFRNFITLLVLLGFALGPASTAWSQDDDEATDDEATDDEATDGEDAEEAPSLADEIGPALGLTLLGTTSVVGGIAYLVDAGSLNDEAMSEVLPDRKTALEDRADRHSALGITLTALGVVMVGTAVYLWVDAIQDHNAAPDDISWQITPTANATGGGIGVFGSF